MNKVISVLLLFILLGMPGNQTPISTCDLQIRCSRWHYPSRGYYSITGLSFVMVSEMGDTITQKNLASSIYEIRDMEAGVRWRGHFEIDGYSPIDTSFVIPQPVIPTLVNMPKKTKLRPSCIWTLHFVPLDEDPDADWLN